MSNESGTVIVDNQVTAVLIIDDGLVIKYANPAAEQLFTQSLRKIVDHPFSSLIQHSSLDLKLLNQPLQNGQSITDSDVTFIINGIRQTVEVTISPIIWQGDAMLIAEMRKVDQQRRISQELNQHVQQQAAKLLIRGLAHEIKNPLGGLRGAAQLLERALPNPELKEYTQMIIVQADRLRLLVDRLIGPQKPGKKQRANLHLVLEKIRQLLELDIGKNIKIERDYDPSLPEIFMVPDQIEQAFLNIISNAAQILANHEAGRIIIRTRTVHQTNIHGQNHKLAAKVDVIDNGPGIPTDLQDTLFYPMVSGREGGTGLGLSIAQNLIDQHQGKIEVVSWPGKTIFTTYLPIKHHIEGEPNE